MSYTDRETIRIKTLIADIQSLRGQQEFWAIQLQKSIAEHQREMASLLQIGMKRDDDDERDDKLTFEAFNAMADGPEKTFVMQKMIEKNYFLS